MYKMYFNTGVRPENRLNKDGKFVLSKWEVVKGGVVQIEYFLERKPENDLSFLYLVPLKYLENKKDYEIAIKIVDGGMLSDYAIFVKHIR